MKGLAASSAEPASCDHAPSSGGESPRWLFVGPPANRCRGETYSGASSAMRSAISDPLSRFTRTIRVVRHDWHPPFPSVIDTADWCRCSERLVAHFPDWMFRRDDHHPPRPIEPTSADRDSAVAGLCRHPRLDGVQHVARNRSAADTRCGTASQRFPAAREVSEGRCGGPGVGEGDAGDVKARRRGGFARGGRSRRRGG